MPAFGAAAIAMVVIGVVEMFGAADEASTRSSQSASASSDEGVGGQGSVRDHGAGPGATGSTPNRPRMVVGTIVGTCDEGGTCGVKQRTQPYTAAPGLVPSALMDGMIVVVNCQASGDVRASAGHGSSATWYRLDNGAYVNSVYLNVDASDIPGC